MKKPAPNESGLAESLSFEDGNEIDLNLANPETAINLFRRPSLGNHYKDARNLAMLLRNMQSGMDAYLLVFKALERKYGDNFKAEFLREVHQ